MSQDPRHILGNKRKALAKNKSKGSEGLGIRNSKNSKSHKKLSHNAEGKKELILLSRELESGKLVENGEMFIGLPLLPKSEWAIWYRNRVAAILDKIIAQIRATLMETPGWFEEELGQAWTLI